MRMQGVNMMRKFKNVFNNILVVSGLLLPSALHAAGEWTVTGSGATYDGSAEITLANGDIIRPTSANAFVSTQTTLPDKVVAEIERSTVAGFAGNTHTLLRVAASGTITFKGASGHLEVVTNCQKDAKGLLTVNDDTASGLSLVAFTASGEAAVGDIIINESGVDTILSIGLSFLPAAGKSPLTLNLTKKAKITLATITSIVKLIGDGALTLGDQLIAIPATDVPRLVGYKGVLTTRAGGTTDISITSDLWVWTLSGAGEIPWSMLKLMKGTVRIPASRSINFSK